MDLRKDILAEHSRRMATRIVRYVGEDQERYDELIRLFMEGDYSLTQRAAWPLGDIGVIYPRLAAKHLPKLIKKLRSGDAHPAIHRNILRILQHAEIPEKYCGPLLDICYGFIRNETAPVAIRAFAITVVSNISMKYPDLIGEFRLTLNDLMQFPQPPAIRVRIRNAMRQLVKAS
jgi:hypothetical protein